MLFIIRVQAILLQCFNVPLKDRILVLCVCVERVWQTQLTLSSICVLVSVLPNHRICLNTAKSLFFKKKHADGRSIGNQAREREKSKLKASSTIARSDRSTE